MHIILKKRLQRQIDLLKVCLPSDIIQYYKHKQIINKLTRLLTKGQYLLMEVDMSGCYCCICKDEIYGINESIEDYICIFCAQDSWYIEEVDNMNMLRHQMHMPEEDVRQDFYISDECGCITQLNGKLHLHRIDRGDEMKINVDRMPKIYIGYCETHEQAMEMLFGRQWDNILFKHNRRSIERYLLDDTGWEFEDEDTE